MRKNRALRFWIAFVLAAIAIQAQSGTVRNSTNDPITPSGLGGGFYSSQGALPVLASGSMATISPPLSGTGAATVSIRPVGAANAVSVPVIRSDQQGIAFVVPATLAPGQVQLIYKREGDVTRWTKALIVPVNFALYRTAFQGPVAAQRIGDNGVGGPVGMATPARPGQIVVLWGSGRGNTPTSAISVNVGGVQQKVLYAGTPFSGLDQFNIQLAPSTPTGCYVPVTFVVGTSTVTSTISISSGGQPCDHPFKLTADELKGLDDGGSINVGLVNTSSSLIVAGSDHAGRQENASFTSESWGQENISLWATGTPAQSGCAIPNPRQSTWITRQGFISSVPGQSNGDISLKNGAATVTLLSSPYLPSSYYSAIPPSADMPLSTLAAPVLAGGVWSISPIAAIKGAVAGAQLTLPEPVRLGGVAPFSLRRDRDAVLTWNGAAYGTERTATLTLYAGGSLAAVVCTAPASAGSITITASILGKLPATSATVSLRVVQNSTAPLATLRLPDSQEALVVLQNSATSDTRPVDIQ